MLKGLRGVPFVMMVAWNLASANPNGSDATPQPEAEQVISAALKKLYMSAAAAVPQSPAQQKLILQMAEKASNGKEVLLTMRAAVGTFPTSAGSEEPPVATQVCTIAAVKMMGFATLDQLIEYALQYPVNPDSARPVVQRMFQLAESVSEPRVWYRIRIAASHLKVSDLEQQAQAKGGRLAGR